MSETVQDTAKHKKVEVSWLDDHMPKYARVIRDKTGLKVKDPGVGVGCGTYGCVYLTDDPRWVVKVTSDRDEGPLALRMVEVRKDLAGGTGYGPSTALQGLVFFKSIFRARPIWHGRKQFSPYVIIRENVRPASDKDVEERMTWYVDESLPLKIDDEDDKKKKQHAKDLAHPGLNIAMFWAKVFHMSKDNIKTMTNAVINYGNMLDKLYDEFPLVVDDMRLLMEERYDLMLQDVHAYNIGYTLVDWGPKYRKVGSAVIHDLGMTPTVPKSRFQMLNPLHIIER